MGMRIERMRTGSKGQRQGRDVFMRENGCIGDRNLL